MGNEHIVFLRTKSHDIKNIYINYNNLKKIFFAFLKKYCKNIFYEH